jgi:hypothetical protein
MRNRLPMIFSITALIIAVLGVTPLGEAAYNAVVPRNSVGTLQLKRNAVKARQLAPNSVRSAHVLNGSLLVTDFKPGQIPQGPKGDKGDKGDKGAMGDPGLSGVEVVAANDSVPASTYGGVKATCPSGKVPIGGGVNTANFNVPITTSRPESDGWGGRAHNGTAGTVQVTTYVVCAKVG